MDLTGETGSVVFLQPDSAVVVLMPGRGNTGNPVGVVLGEFVGIQARS